MEINILKLIDIGENVEIECKEAKQGLPRDLWETYSSFANTNGGVLLLGVKQTADTFQIIGVDARKRLKEFWDLINNPQKVSTNLLEDKDVQVINIDGKDVITINVPRAKREQKPIFIGQNPMVGTFRRNYEGDYRCSPEEVKSMFLDQSGLSIDSRVLENFGLDDMNMDSFRSYRERFASIRPAHPWSGLSDKEFLYQIGAWGKTRESGKDGLTVAGLLMFGYERGITEVFPNYFLEYREINSKDSIVRWDYRTTSSDGTWSGNLYDFYFKIINRITDNINIPFRLEGFTRKDDTRVHQALREALANTIIHADYTGKQGIVIKREPDAFIFSNPGTLRISIEQALQGGISDPRNANLFKMFLLIGVGERAGSGLFNIQLAWKEQNWRNPLLIEKFQPNSVELIMRTTSLLPQESLAMLRGILKKLYFNLSREEILALVTAHQEGQVTNSRLQILSGENATEVGKIFSRLVEKGLLVTDGQRRGMRYFLSEMFNTNQEINGNNSINSGSNSINSGSNSINSGSNSINSGSNSVIPHDGGELIKRKLLEISKLAREKKRIDDINKMKDIIIRLCEVRPLQLRELSELLNRSQDGIRNNYLGPLIDEGKIKLLYPGQLNHPKQAYMKAEEK